MLRRCSLPDRGEYRQAAGVAAQGLDPRLFTPLWPVKTTRRTKARTIKADATIGSQPPTFRSDLLKRAKHSGHLCTSRASSRSKFGAALRARHYTGVGHARKDKVTTANQQ